MIHSRREALNCSGLPRSTPTCENHDITLAMRTSYASALYSDDGAKLDDLREAVETLEDIERTARRVLGGAHPLTSGIERELQKARAALRARETPSPGNS